MNTDFRIKIGFSRHTKTLKLKRRLGADGVLALIALWEYTALNKPDGLLSGMDCEDIALATGWEGDSEHLVHTLVKVGWLDESPAGYRVHEWGQHNEWAAKAEDRSEYFRELAKKRHHSKPNSQSEPEQDQNCSNGTQNATPSDTQNGTPSVAPSDTQNATQAIRNSTRNAPIPTLPLPTSPIPSSPIPSSPYPTHPVEEAVEESRKEEVDAAALASPANHGPKAKAEPKSARLWDAYATVYQDRYGVAPIRNAKVNSQLCQLVDRLGAEAPAVAGFYLRHNNAWYVKHGHSVGCLLADAEKLRTEWATGRQITAAGAQELDRKQATVNAYERLQAKYAALDAANAAKANAHAH